MANVSIMGGAEIDICSSDELSKGLKDTGDSIVRSLRPREKTIMRKSAINAGVMPAAGPLTLSLLVVPSDVQVSVSVVTVTGVDDHTVLALGIPVVYFGGSSALPSRGDVVAIGTAVPFVQTWGEKTLWGHDGDELFVIVYGAAAGSQVVVTAKYHEWLAGDAEPRRL